MIKVDYVKTRYIKGFLRGYGYGQAASLYSAYMTKIALIQSRSDFESTLSVPLNQASETVTSAMIAKYGGNWSQNNDAIEEFYSNMITAIDNLLGISTVAPVIPAIATAAPAIITEAIPAITTKVAPVTTIAVTIPAPVKEYLPYVLGGIIVILLLRRR